MPYVLIFTAVPPEVIVRGPLALEAYNKALTEGMTCDNRVPVMFIGQERSGKTSLKKSLRGEPFNKDEASTVGIDVDHSYFKVSTEIWKVGEKDKGTPSKSSISYTDHLARLTVENLRQEKSALNERQPGNTPLIDTVSAGVSKNFSSVSLAVPSTSSRKSAEVDANSVTRASNSASDVPSTSIQDPQSRETSRKLESIQTSRDSEPGESKPHIPEDVGIEIVKRLQNKDTAEDKDNIYSVLWDFAGQSVYYATHPLFLTSRAIYLLVNDLSQNHLETAKPIVKQGVFGEFEDSFGLKTNFDYLDFWMSSVASLVSQEESGDVDSNSEMLSEKPEKLPPVLLVCTHADEPYGDGNPLKLTKKIFESLQTKPYQGHLYDFFVVDNTKSGKSECSEVVRLREEVLAISRELPQMKEAIPIKWLKYEKEVQATREKGHKWISLETAKEIASEKCRVVDDKEFQTLLNFLHDKRILVHFDDTPELDKLVVLDPQWLIDVFKKVITVKPFDHKEKKFTPLWCKLERNGILEEKLLEHVWSSLSEDKETFESLIAIMEKFSLLCVWPSPDASCGKQYLVPSMLRTHPPEDVMKLVQVASTQIPPLFIKFKYGQVPPGLFPRLVLLFLKWGKEKCFSPEKTKLFHNFARFYTSEEVGCSVILLCFSSFIKVVVCGGNPIHESGAQFLRSKMTLSPGVRYNTFEVTFACKVHKQLDLLLESMRKEFCWLKNMRYEVTFICPVCCQADTVKYCDTHHVQGCKQEECLHFLSASQLCNAKKSISCTKSAAAPNSRIQIEQFAPWFTNLGNQVNDFKQFSLSSLKQPSQLISRESDWTYNYGVLQIKYTRIRNSVQLFLFMYFSFFFFLRQIYLIRINSMP